MIYIHTYLRQAFQSLYFFFWSWKVENLVIMQINHEGKQPLTYTVVGSPWQYSESMQYWFEVNIWQYQGALCKQMKNNRIQ